MKLPRGELRRRRVVTDLETPLGTILDDRLTGYARLEAQDSLLLDADGVGVLTFETGIPVLAYHTGTDNGGPTALADISVSGPYRVELYELTHTALSAAHEATELQVPPGMPAEQLAGSPELAERTREHAPSDRLSSTGSATTERDAIEEFLDNEEAIAEIRERARKEATMRADEWNLAVEGAAGQKS